ncbi:MAG TPA: glyoxalase/bleomycin resistance/dioxygenase family protein [Cryomorphaceae bacterium]|nr:glyoxalase/bleomycin resistance/dioxygenase family protein [Owenweeksia sp.]MBF99247.1 glyoxalase/bleomycin resistance/dioxygenase family protein [Owenweeksia sp.]HAD97937.1 glyoxalase/bleomycin resistance/dioxygenase family protein [Cryomorphaceae bacterium]HBF20699.1 glyoxalase/bleomycin resistance/dioxygenase family protein [Cryomorphaceae bacterium]HCQ16679.1 glyoxalase/bleomycin resistance/dioxygenase family protein [Cryomorphaceae bacterium]|tara:strand:+ start:4570 stop:5076 length:507 start_codon:yes stop_codon:yes gene_type:complete
MSNFPRMHVSLYVSQLQESLDFYQRLFDVKPDKVKPQYARFTLAEPSLIISFIENASRVNPNFGHLGFEVQSRELMLEKLEQARSRNIVSLEEIGTACCYALQDKFWATDPDGHQWEVYYKHADTEFNDPRYASEDTSACCTKEQEERPELKLAANAEACCEPGSGCC